MADETKYTHIILNHAGFYRLVTIKRVGYKRKTEVYGTLDVPGFGKVPRSRETGKVDKSILDVTTDRENCSVRADRDSIRKKIRRLRDQELEQINAIDAQIDELRKKRSEILAKAWDKGNVVTVKELTDQIK